jgi:hypothetical protein
MAYLFTPKPQEECAIVCIWLSAVLACSVKLAAVLGLTTIRVKIVYSSDNRAGTIKNKITLLAIIPFTKTPVT